MIEVRRTKGTEPLEFEVTVSEGVGQTRHRVTLSEKLFEKIAGSSGSPEACVKSVFEFLLEREPKESILSSFDVSVVSTYFPNFEREIHWYL